MHFIPRVFHELNWEKRKRTKRSKGDYITRYFRLLTLKSDSENFGKHIEMFSPTSK